MSAIDIKAKLMAEAEAALEAMLAKAARGKPLKMRDIVALAVESGPQVERAILATLSQEPGERATTAAHGEACGRVMHRQGRRRRAVVTEAGETRLERAYYYCAACNVGRFPPG
jgi:transposase